MATICTALAIGLAGCSDSGRVACAPKLGKPMTVFTLYFGTSIPHRDGLTAGEWRSFLGATVTPNLPNGYTVMDGSGAWMDPRTQRTITEGTKVLVAALPESPESLAAIGRVRSAYQAEFDQQLVGMTVQPACGSF